MTFHPAVRYIGEFNQCKMNMKKIRFFLSVVMAVTVFVLSGCEEDEYVLYIEKGKFVVLEEPYQHPYASGITISSVILVEGDSVPEFPDRPIIAYYISGHTPAGYNAGDTVTVRAKIKEIYPKGITITVADNVNVYKLKDIERIK